MTCEDKDMKELADKLKAHYDEKVKKVENAVTEHPIPSILVAAGVGILIGALLCKMHKSE